MFKTNLKKINSVILLLFLYISVENLTKFNDDEIEMPRENNLYLDELTIDTTESIIEDNDDLQVNNIESQINESLKKRFKLVKKISNEEVSSGDIAYYSDTDVASDYVYNQDEGNLIPVYERILFSGIPEPLSKPIPNKPEYFKSITLSLKNEKMLIKNLENYLNKVDFSTVFEGLKDFFNYSIEENITFFMDENDNVVEIQTFSKNLQNSVF